MNNLEKRLVGLVRPEAEGMGLVLWGLSAPTAGDKRIVRIYLDGPEGVTIDQCAKLSRQVSVILEVEDFIPGAYVLEVSSPGLERRFYDVAQTAAYVGRKLNLSLLQAEGGQRKFQGTLEGTEGDILTIQVEGETRQVPWSSIKEAHLVHDF